MADAMGIIASLLVCVSFIPKNILIIRILNLAGSVFFIIYGTMVGATWNAATNAFLFMVNLIWIIKIFRERKTPK